MAQQQLAMVIDASKCIDCKACMFSCKAANKVPKGYWRNWVKASVPDFGQGMQVRTSYQPGGCMHCEQPTCVQACPTGATYKDKNTGEVVIDKSLCIGCGNCIPACPYDARFRHPELKKADKCNYCAERRAGGLQPACVDTCPTKARVFGDINDPKSNAAQQLAKGKSGKGVTLVENTDTPTKPNMFYVGETAPANWPRKAVIPASMTTMTGIVDPLVKTVAVLSGAGVLAMLGRQLFGGSKKSHHDEPPKQDSKPAPKKEAGPPEQPENKIDNKADETPKEDR